MNKRAITGLTGAVTAAACGVAALFGFGIVGGTTPVEDVPRTSAPVVSQATLTRIAVAGDTGTLAGQRH